MSFAGDQGIVDGLEDRLIDGFGADLLGRYDMRILADLQYFA